VTGVYAHGLAGDLMVKRKGQMGLVASDLLEGLGEVWVRWGR
jgi:NAD(P)H-hydrate epimerase